VDESSPLSDNAAFVESLYIEFLKRAGDTTVPAAAGNWVTGLNHNTITPAQVVSSLIHSSEGLGLLLDGLYLKVLGRIADSGGRNSFINFLQKGGTVEQVISIMMTSAEYNRLTGSDGGFLHSLYIRLLGRMATSSEIATGMSNLQTMGRAGVVNALLKSTEFRTDVVQQIYGFNLAPPASVVSLLPPLPHRTTDAATTDVNGLVVSTQDILTLDFSFAASGESFTDG